MARCSGGESHRFYFSGEPADRFCGREYRRRKTIEDSWTEARREPEDKGIKARNPALSGELSGSRRDRPPAPGPKRLGEIEGKTPTTHHQTRPSGEPKARRKEGPAASLR
ncbi:hypothetical protein L596_000399 [Steinernema carpocapsae]|uniref:Uncharacterized protein n=1 Tax=Steinernema carpocapsae TaxID=34508 RepID=A0A4U8UJF1_STECR|nr:hypothetical protein L596_000399 [Steinernema carpocapsae]